MEKLSRRRLLCSTGCACAAACLPRFATAYGKPVNIGAPEEFEVDGISEKFIRHDFLVVRRKDRLYAIIATCPHQENYLFRDPANPEQISCAGHDAYFDLEGSPLSGPVKQGLLRFKVTREKNGHIRVDPSTRFAERQWKEKDSFIELE